MPIDTTTLRALTGGQSNQETRAVNPGDSSRHTLALGVVCRIGDRAQTRAASYRAAERLPRRAGDQPKPGASANPRRGSSNVTTNHRSTNPDDRRRRTRAPGLPMLSGSSSALWSGGVENRNCFAPASLACRCPSYGPLCACSYPRFRQRWSPIRSARQAATRVAARRPRRPYKRATEPRRTAVAQGTAGWDAARTDRQRKEFAMAVLEQSVARPNATELRGGAAAIVEARPSTSATTRQGAGPRPARRQLLGRPRRDGRDHGPERLGQDDAAELPLGARPRSTAARC